MAPSLIAALAGSLVYAQEAGEPAESDRSRLPLLYIDPPVFVEDGANPVMPLGALVADPEADPAFGQRLDSIRLYSNTVADIELDGG